MPSPDSSDIIASGRGTLPFMTPTERKARALVRLHLTDITSTDMFIESTSEEQAAIVRLVRQYRQLALEVVK